MIRKNTLAPIVLVCLFCIVLLQCRRPFEPSLKQSDINTLVVEGYIDGGAPTRFVLSRARNVSVNDTATRKFELHAQVMIEDDHQNTVSLTEEGDGVYSSVSLIPTDPSFKYRIHIITAEGREYQSDLVPFKVSPPIDSIGWKFKNNGVQVYVNTGDPTNATTYYQWTFGETWEIQSQFATILKYDEPTNTVVMRNDQVFTCWRDDSSNSILLDNTTQFTSDVVNGAPITYIENHDKKLSVLYSIFIRQYALDVNAYNYLEALKSNSENTGSIFDPQPNQTTGNIHCLTDPAENVIGYVSAGITSVRRVFIKNSEVPFGWNIVPSCPEHTVPNNPDSIRAYFDGGYSPISAVQNNGAIIGYDGSYSSCVDCTVLGTNVKPSFWP